MIDENESLEIDSSIGKEPCEIRIAASYLRGYARNQADRGTELMPQDSIWTKGVRKLYRRLSDSDRDFIDSYASDVILPTKYRKDREKRLKQLALLLLIEVGKQSPFTMLLPVGVEEYVENERNQEKTESGSSKSDVRIQ